VDGWIQERSVRCDVLRADSPWFGMTYQEDREPVRAAIHALIAAGDYPETLRL
jgi:hypothetical protein